MTLDEVDGPRGEIPDGLCHRLAETHRNARGEPMPRTDQAAFRGRFEGRGSALNLDHRDPFSREISANLPKNESFRSILKNFQ